MNPLDRIYRIDQIIHQRRVVRFDDLMRELEVSRATLKRDLAFLRDRLNAPIVFDRDAGGYRFSTPSAGPQYELPGLWFNDREVLALLTMHRMLQDLDTGGLLGPHVQPLIERLDAARLRAAWASLLLAVAKASSSSLCDKEMCRSRCRSAAA